VFPREPVERGKLGNRKITCVLAHDHVLLRQGLRRLLEDEPDIEVSAEAGSVAEALQTVSERGPEIVITDASFFGLAADQVEQMIVRASPQSKVVFLNLSAGDDEPGGAQNGGPNRVLRQTSAKELGEIIRRTYLGQRQAVWEMRGMDLEKRLAEERARKEVLTDREREVLELLAGGKTVRSAANILGLSAKTVDAHKFNLMRKLGIHNKAELVMWAIQKRVVKLPANY